PCGNSIRLTPKANAPTWPRPCAMPPCVDAAPPGCSVTVTRWLDLLMAPLLTPPPRLRIAFVVHDYNRHLGHSRYVAELATRYNRAHDIHIYANTFDEPHPQELTFHRILAWRRFALTSCLSFIVPATLGVRGNYDIIHAQGLCGLRHNVATAHFCQPAWY